MEFCTGLKESADLSQETAGKGKNVLMGVIFIIQTLICTEVTMYLVIFWGLHKQNKFHTRGLSLETIKHRNKKNAITLSGQVLSFVVELCTSIIAQLLIMDNSFGILEPAALTCWIIVITSTVSVLQFMTSPELRRFYIKWLLFRIKYALVLLLWRHNVLSIYWAFLVCFFLCKGWACRWWQSRLYRCLKLFWQNWQDTGCWTQCIVSKWRR